MQQYTGRAQCLVVRGDKILMACHIGGGRVHYCLPGGGIEPGETPEQAALRELREECNVEGTVIAKTSEWHNPAGGHKSYYTYHIDIGGQTPTLGYDPDVTGPAVLDGIHWMTLDEIYERDRAYLWAAGLMGIPQFGDIVFRWGDEISYPADGIIP